jgi:Protein of unknown function (DUF2621)
MTNEMIWSDKAKEIYEKVTDALPEFHRTIAKKLVKEASQELAKARNLTTVEEKEVVETFFKEVPPAFRTMMVRLFEHLKIDYKKYTNA